MKPTDAAQVLGLSGAIGPDDVKQAYHRAALQYHPDVNPAGAEMMQIVNAAYEALQGYAGEIEASQDSGIAYPEAVNAALNAIIDLIGLDIEICGAWVWVSGATYPHRATLKEAAFRYASKKQRWYFRPEGWRSSSRGTYTMDDIRNRYGSDAPHFTHREQLPA